MANKHKRLLLVIFLLAVILRFAALGNKSIWFDEAYSVSRASLQQTEIWNGKSEPMHPPLYYSVLHAWIAAAGKSEVAIRLLSTFASTLSLAVFYLLGWHLFGKDTALTAVSLLAVSPIDIWYAQEARMYALVTLASLLTALGLVTRHWWGVFLASITLTTR